MKSYPPNTYAVELIKCDSIGVISSFFLAGKQVLKKEKRKKKAVIKFILCLPSLFTSGNPQILHRNVSYALPYQLQIVGNIWNGGMGEAEALRWHICGQCRHSEGPAPLSFRVSHEALRTSVKGKKFRTFSFLTRKDFYCRSCFYKLKASWNLHS